jgi:hypothetical protein
MVEGEREMRERLDASLIPTEWMEGRVGVSEAIWPSSSGVSVPRMYQIVSQCQRAQQSLQQSIRMCERWECAECDPEMRTRENPQDEREVTRENPQEKGEIQENLRFEIEIIARCAQRKMMGFLLGRIREAQIFMEQKVKKAPLLTARLQRLIMRTNDMMIPWVRGLCKIAKGATFEKLDRWWSNEQLPKTRKLTKGTNVLYVRMNLYTKDIYVGETEDWEARGKQHAYMYNRHSGHCANKCTNCEEHAKYMKQQKVKLSEWITMPLTICADRIEAKKMELMLRRKWRPSLNTEDKPFWLLKDTYTAEHAGKKKRDNLPPWKRPRRQEGGAMITQYIVDGETRYDLRQIFKNNEDNEINLKCNIGQRDLTNWRKIRFEYATSYVSVHLKNGEREITTVENWKPREETREVQSIYIKPTLGPKRRWAMKLIKPVMRNIRRLQKATEHELDGYWHTRNVLDKASRIKLRQIINAECTRRYECHTWKS